MEIDLYQFGSSVLALADDHGDGLAAIAALVGVPLIIWQIFQGARHERKKARARRYAALASLPMTLSGINRWAKEVAQALNAIEPWVSGDARTEPPPTFAPPPSPDHLISAIEQMIEAAPGGRIGKTLAAIVSDIQVLNSRIGDAAEYHPARLRSQHGAIDSNLYLAAQIYSRAESLYDSARSLSADAPIDHSRVATALNIMDVREGERRVKSAFPTAHEMNDRAGTTARQRRRGWEKIRDWIVEAHQARKAKKRYAEVAASMAANRVASASEDDEGQG
jgi:hypothetical protein